MAAETMEIKVDKSHLLPVRYDIMVDGKRYGYAFREANISLYDLRERVRWIARMDIPDRVDSRSSFHHQYAVSDTLDDAVQLAFEDFAARDDLAMNEYVKIAKQLFESQESVAST